MKIVYLAGLRRQIGVAEEIVTPPENIDRIDPLILWLKQRSPAHDKALSSCQRLMVAVNQDYASGDRLIKADDEIAFFPPVTGG